mgnify:CR=1 FL=1
MHYYQAFGLVNNLGLQKLIDKIVNNRGYDLEFTMVSVKMTDILGLADDYMSGVIKYETFDKKLAPLLLG